LPDRDRRLLFGDDFHSAGRRIWKDIPAPLASRPPMGQLISLSLTEAAKTTGLSESTILAIIEDGQIAAMNTGWLVAQLCHVFPARTSRSG
jgi:excisionase family DNA binding protein